MGSSSHLYTHGYVTWEKSQIENNHWVAARSVKSFLKSLNLFAPAVLDTHTNKHERYGCTCNSYIPSLLAVHGLRAWPRLELLLYMIREVLHPLCHSVH